MFKDSKHGIISCVLLISTIYLVYSIIVNSFDQDNIILALITTIGFILLGNDKRDSKCKQY